MHPKTVRITRSREDITEILRKAVKDAAMHGKKRVFIKPNMSHPEYVPGVVTDPIMLQQLVGLLRNSVEEVIVGESNGFNYPCSSAFKNTGIETAVKAAGGTVINLSEDKLVRTKFRNVHHVLKELDLPKTVVEADAIVDVALMKTHEFTKFSGAIKNLFGCVPDNRRIFLHPYLNEVFHTLYRILKPELVIMDARIALEGNGPTKGDPVKMDLMLTGDDALAIDLVASGIMGLKLEKVRHLDYISKQEGLGTEDIEVQGVQVREVTRRFKTPRIDLPVRAQIEIYKHEYLTKVFFCSLPIVKLFQKLTVAYRGKPIEAQLA